MKKHAACRKQKRIQQILTTGGNLSKVRSKHQQPNTQTYYWCKHILGVAPCNRLIMANQNT